MSYVSTRDALAKAIGEVPPCDHRLYGPCRECEADALIASGAVVDVATLVDDKGLVDAIAANQRDVAHSWGDPLPASECNLRARTALRALAAALTERAS